MWFRSASVKVGIEKADDIDIQAEEGYERKAQTRFVSSGWAVKVEASSRGKRGCTLTIQSSGHLPTVSRLAMTATK